MTIFKRCEIEDLNQEIDLLDKQIDDLLMSRGGSVQRIKNQCDELRCAVKEHEQERMKSAAGKTRAIGVLSLELHEIRGKLQEQSKLNTA